MYAVPEINSVVYYYQFHMRHVRLADPRSHLKSEPLTLNFWSASCAFHCMVYPVRRQRLPTKEICKGFTRFPDREGPKLKSGNYQKGTPVVPVLIVTVCCRRQEVCRQRVCACMDFSGTIKRCYSCGSLLAEISMGSE